MTSGLMYKWMEGWMHGLVGRWMDRNLWMDEKKGKWMEDVNGWVGGWVVDEKISKWRNRIIVLVLAIQTPSFKKVFEISTCLLSIVLDKYPTRLGCEIPPLFLRKNSISLFFLASDAKHFTWPQRDLAPRGQELGTSPNTYIIKAPLELMLPRTCARD